MVAAMSDDLNLEAAARVDVAHRARFARSAVFEMFPYKHARAINYNGFVDRHPSQPPRPPASLRRMANGRAST